MILSACETAGGKIVDGEGVIGMTWALFLAGVPTTVATNWKIDSEGTVGFMKGFTADCAREPHRPRPMPRAATGLA